MTTATGVPSSVSAVGIPVSPARVTIMSRRRAASAVEDWGISES
ncbi:hypothetical protein [Streptomyces amakusaensis]|uniref:Uncharacterized protein n=1 Tax=Streptomyces amakusaensis TaxID=67271 RepID=A0ABW0AMP3_9ACTN